MNMLKVVYFDEGSAIDYLDIFNGGTKSLVNLNEQQVKTDLEGGLQSSANTGILFKALKPFMDINLGAKLEANFSKLGESVVKATISNTVLSDFIKIADNDENIEKTQDCIISAFPESITFMKMYAPYFKMIEFQNDSSLQNNPINFQKVDETLEKGKGYYEMIGEREESKIILRFNIKAFRNNYNLVDLTRMNLMFYSVRVGRMQIENLNVNQEFNFTKKEKILTADQVIKSEIKNKEDAVVYDVILSGIKE